MPEGESKGIQLYGFDGAQLAMGERSMRALVQDGEPISQLSSSAGISRSRPKCFDSSGSIPRSRMNKRF